MKLLYVTASPRGTEAFSIVAGAAFLDALNSTGVEPEIDRLDLWNSDLPAFDGPLIAAKYAKLAGREMKAAEAEAWERIGALTASFAAVDAIVIATPMWNFGIPYRLKHWIDLITQPGLTFSFDPVSGYAPVVPTRPVLVILSSAGNYNKGPSYGRPDLATPYLEAALSFLGLSPIVVERVGPTAGPPDVVRDARAAAVARLTNRAAHFLVPKS